MTNKNSTVFAKERCTTAAPEETVTGLWSLGPSITNTNRKSVFFPQYPKNIPSRYVIAIVSEEQKQENRTIPYYLFPHPEKTEGFYGESPDEILSAREKLVHQIPFQHGTLALIDRKENKELTRLLLIDPHRTLKNEVSHDLPRVLEIEDQNKTRLQFQDMPHLFHYSHPPFSTLNTLRKDHRFQNELNNLMKKQGISNKKHAQTPCVYIKFSDWTGMGWTFITEKTNYMLLCRNQIIYNDPEPYITKDWAFLYATEKALKACGFQPPAPQRGSSLKRLLQTLFHSVPK